MRIPEYDQCDCGIRGPHARCREKKPNKYPACQECSRADDGQCDTCVSIEKWPVNGKSPSDRIMKTIREEVQESLAAAKLAGYRQAQLEEFHHLCGITNAEIIERIMHLRKELGLDIIKNR